MWNHRSIHSPPSSASLAFLSRLWRRLPCDANCILKLPLNFIIMYVESAVFLHYSTSSEAKHCCLFNASTFCSLMPGRHSFTASLKVYISAERSDHQMKFLSIRGLLTVFCSPEVFCLPPYTTASAANGVGVDDQVLRKRSLTWAAAAQTEDETDAAAIVSVWNVSFSVQVSFTRKAVLRNSLRRKTNV